MTSANKINKPKIKSMTGFGKGHASGRVTTVDIEISTVNRKQFDARISMPRSLLVLESKIQKLLRGCISRGTVNCNVRVSSGKSNTSAKIVTDDSAAEAAIKKIRSMARKLGLEQDLKASDMLKIPGVIQVEKEDHDPDRTWTLIRKALTEASERLEVMRVKEGASLHRDLIKRFAKLASMTDKIKTRIPGILDRYEKQLRKTLEDFDQAEIVQNHEILREVGQYADRCDISEELTRLQSHFEQAEELFSSSKPVGRTLDFLCQEILREINTVGSKASDSKVARIVVLFKSELEAIREQVQNIE